MFGIQSVKPDTLSLHFCSRNDNPSFEIPNAYFIAMNLPIPYWDDVSCNEELRMSDRMPM